ncbi:DUF6414 family protein [Nocardiopsis nanhaiensis]
MAIWNRKRNEPRDRHREFIYLDEVSVISLLAGLQGEIKNAVTETLARTTDRSLSGSLGVASEGTAVESRLGTSRTSTNEVVRRAVIQSTFRDLWRRDVGVLLHDAAGVKRKSRKTIHSYSGLEDALPRLKKSKLAVPLGNITRGDIVELDIEVEADEFFKMITVATTLLDLFRGRDELFDASAAEFRKLEPMIEVLKELLVGLIPVRGLATSHRVIAVAGEQVVIASELLGEDLQADARRVELVGFAEANSFWRDLRRTLFSGSTFTVYARAEGPPLTDPWSPFKIADLLESLSPGLRDEMVLPLQGLFFKNARAMEAPDSTATARFQVTSFASELQSASGANPDAASVNQAVEEAIPRLASATSRDERRHIVEPVVQAVAGEDVNRCLLLTTRSKWIEEAPVPEPIAAPTSPPPTEPGVPPVQLEVGFVALYW